MGKTTATLPTLTKTSKINVIQQQPWIFCHFQKDKLKYSERYHQKLVSAVRTSSSNQPLILIPDGPFLRKYLGLLENLLQPNTSIDDSSDLTLLILESAAEFMDVRNSSPCISEKQSNLTKKKTSQSQDFTLTKEASSVHERSRIVKLWQKCSGDCTSSVNVFPFLDLTYRNGILDHYEEDDFDLLSYEDMSVEDRSRCSLVRAAQMYSHVYSRHFSRADAEVGQLRMSIILLTEDKIHLDSVDLREALSDKVSIQAMDCSGLTDLLKRINNSTEHRLRFDNIVQDEHWINLQQECEEEYERRNRPQSHKNGVVSVIDFGHSEYLKDTEQALGLKQNRFFKGKMKVTDGNPKEAYVSVQLVNGKKVEYFLNGNHGHFNRALHEDIVIIEPLPEENWEEPVGKVRLMHESDGHNSGNREEASLAHRNVNIKASFNQTVPTAHVIAIHTYPSQRRKFIATLQSLRSNLQRHESSILVVPMDKRIPKIRIKTNVGYDKLVKKRLLVGIDGWDADSYYPRGHFVKIIGEVGDLETEISCLLIEHDIALAPFSSNALSCLPSLIDGKWNVPQEEIRERRDLRNSLIFSVDPPGCQDIDDAMHATRLKNGDIEVGVHIADVCYFLPQRSALDIEASKRGTTFYLVDRRFDMLPSLLSSDLCSLHGKIDRLAVSVIWTFTANFEKVKSVWYGRTVIHNVQAMTYNQAHNILQNRSPDDPGTTFPPPLTAGGRVNEELIHPLKKSLTILTKLARKLRSDREVFGGAVDLTGDQGSELKFTLDSDGKPIKVVPKKELEIHNTIAEMMIMANAFVAKKIHENFPDISLLRIHRAVEKDNFGELESLLNAGGISFDGRSNFTLAESLKNAKKNEKKSPLISLFQSVATRAMTEAQYICTGSHIGQLGHYGLGIDFYTHFTSPIRRYADIIVHRLLLASILKREKDMEDDLHDDNILSKERMVTFIPESQAMSVLKGDGNDELNYIDRSDYGQKLDAAVDDKAAMIVKPPERSFKNKPSRINDIYKQNQVTKICEILNEQNRTAKACAFQCQRLFLSLFFRNNADVAPAVVLSLRQNGMIVYVPKYDIKGPVFLCNHDGHVQIDPRILGISEAIGASLTNQGLQIYPDGQCILNEDNTLLEVRIPGVKEYVVLKRLDVITIRLSCNISESTSRVAPPSLHLISLERNYSSKAHQRLDRDTSKNVINSKTVEESQRPNFLHKSKESIDIWTGNHLSIFHTLSSVPISSSLDDTELKQKRTQKLRSHSERVETISGRLIYSGFKNGNSSSVMPLLRQNNTMGRQAMEDSVNAYNRIEREATARIQRLAAGKRNSKRTKATKK